MCATLQEFADCLTVNGDATKCGDLREDYFECLHHNKEVRGALSDSRCCARLVAREVVRVGWCALS